MADTHNELSMKLILIALDLLGGSYDTLEVKDKEQVKQKIEDARMWVKGAEYALNKYEPKGLVVGAFCASCGREFSGAEHFTFCPDCGQLIDWVDDGETGGVAF